MNRVRSRLVIVFLATTLPPLLVTLWIANSLLERSLEYSATQDLDRVSVSLERTARLFYQREREQLAADAGAGAVKAAMYVSPGQRIWPAEVREFFDSGQQERFLISGEGGDTLVLLRRSGDGVASYRRLLGGLKLDGVREEYTRARQTVADSRHRNLPRGFLYTLVLLGALPWLGGLSLLLYFAHRISRPIHELTGALEKVAAGDLAATLPEGRSGEVGSAMKAFNRMTAELRQGRERLLYLARMESWQALARKTAHELKNSLTPIRLTMEEMAARPAADEAFRKQAAQIVVDEVNSLERRVRAFSEYAAEPPVSLRAIDAAAVLKERVLLLRNAHPELDYRLRLDAEPAHVLADEDLLKAVVTNLLVNASDAAGPQGAILVSAKPTGERVAIEVHDSGPGLSDQAAATLFEPTISFKKGGMGLGLSIARKSALLCGGDIVLVKGELGGAGFRVLLSATCPQAAS